MIVPPYESPDEPAHVQFVRFLATHRALADLRHEINEAGIESPQAPLYYVIAGAVLALAGNPAMDSQPALNKRFLMPATAPTNAYRFLPLSTPSSAIHLLRAVSTVLGMITILMTFALAYILTEQRDVALLAASLTAFLPQFTFLAGSVNNDNMAAAAGALAILFIARLGTAKVGNRDWFWVGVVVGIALLAKAGLLVLLPIALLAVWFATDPPKSNVLKNGLPVLVGVAVSSGWYFARNFYLYGDWVYLGAWDSLVPELVPLRAPGWSYYWNPFPQLFVRSYFGVFGWMNVFLPPPFYLMLMGEAFVSIVGLWLIAWKRRYRPVSVWAQVFLSVFLTFISALVWNLTYIAPQGRLMFGAISSISTLLAWGCAMYPSRVRRFLFVALPVSFLAVNLFSVYLVFTMYHA